jgi:thioredoxin 2
MNEPVHIVCPRDDAVIRVPANRLGDGPKCGKCHRPLFNGEPTELTAARFDIHAARSSIPLLVDFWAPWCGPCLSMAPAYQEAAHKLEPHVRLAKVDTESEPALAQRFGIRSIPTLILFSGGREVARQSGAVPAATIVAWVRSQLG